MKNNKAKLLAAAVAMGISAQASAAIELYNTEGTTFSVDGYFNTFYVHSSVDGGPQGDNDQSRVKMGFLPNYIGFNFSKKIDDLTVGGRSSFWVTINDSDATRAGEAGRGDSLGTDSGIDVRQFYATVDGSFGQILIGKDFGLFNRAVILGDELLIGYGQSSDTLGLVDGGNVSFGNIATGYTYPFPKAQITYRTPATNGFQLAVGLMDPNKSDVNSEETAPRFEAEVTYAGEMFSANISTLYQSSDSTTGGEDVDTTGVAGGVKFKAAGFALGLSAFSGEGMGTLAGLDTLTLSEDNEVEGYLVQASYTAGATRFVVSYGNSESDADPLLAGADAETENTAFGIFHSVNSNLILIGEYNMTEVEVNGAEFEENDTIALGAVVLF
ncbi:porin [Neptuniibacter sp. CAU 1671]|uniref:porin n=1 Tax=Neptuniibacter sp. CAU 1671 TaxID=3032593 RepID=UPI0023DB9EE5|nr:porin [Neptuniibacter sp. CAU 1671]MDF2180772.1 porin [Neptuniibacter sp. CAU 1671]